MPQQPATVSKAAFAEMCNVHPSRVSHWIKDGRINGDAIAGEGRGARIVVAVAQKQLKGRLDPYQMLATGNGAGTRLDARPAAAAQPTDDAEGGFLPGDAKQLWAILSEVPSDVAWDIAEAGETTQRAYDHFANMRMNLTAFVRMRGFDLPDGLNSFAPVDWPGLAEEMGMTLVDPVAMHADWDHRRLAD